MSTPTITIVGTILKRKGDHDIIQAGTGRSGKAYCRFRVIASDRRKQDDGSWAYGDSCARECVAFGPMAEHITASIHDKCEVIVIGRERDKQWTDQQGVTHYGQEVVVEDFGLSLRWDSYTKTGQQQQSSGFAGTARQQQTTAQPPASDPWSDYDAQEPEF